MSHYFADNKHVILLHTFTQHVTGTYRRRCR